MFDNLQNVFQYEDYQEGILDPRMTALWGDQYALTMSQAFHTLGMHNNVTTFHAYQRSMPFGGQYMITGGQNIIFEWLRDHWKFDAVDQKLMRKKMVINPLTGQPERLFTDAFIEFVANEPLRLSVDAIREGDMAFADEPIYRVHGPLWQCLMVEAAILNVINSQSLFATLASQLSDLCEGSPILEFGLRRTQSIGGLEPSRGVWLGGGSGIAGGGITGTSNMLAEKFYGIPSSGTMAHAFIMTCESELEAFANYAKAMPYNGVFLVDTYNTLNGVKNAIATCKKYGVKLKGIRLDSGDMVYLSKEARKMLDEAGFNDTKIIASDSLSYKEITRLKAAGAPIDIFAIGGYLVNSPDQVSLGPVYKIGAVYHKNLAQETVDTMRALAKNGELRAANDDFVRNVIKMSETAVKVTIPGEMEVIRTIFRDVANGYARFDGDVIVPHWGPSISAVGADGIERLTKPLISVRKGDDTDTHEFRVGQEIYRPLKRAFTAGAMGIPLETVHVGRARVIEVKKHFPVDYRGMNIARDASKGYVAGIEQGLFDERKGMIRRIKREIDENKLKVA